MSRDVAIAWISRNSEVSNELKVTRYAYPLNFVNNYCDREVEVVRNKQTKQTTKQLGAGRTGLYAP